MENIDQELGKDSVTIRLIKKLLDMSEEQQSIDLPRFGLNL